MPIIAINLSNSLLKYLDNKCNGNRSHFIRTLLENHQNNNYNKEIDIHDLIKQELTILLNQHGISITDINKSSNNTKINNAFSSLIKQMME